MFSRQVPHAILLTVPFTGTTFTKALLQHSTAYIPDAHWTDSIVSEQWSKIKLRKIIVTARDPYLCAIRYIKTNAKTPIEDAAAEWNTMLNKIKEVDHFVFNINCPESKRHEHAIALFKFVNADAPCKIDSFVHKWQAENVSSSEHKTRYLETGELPIGHDWSKLDRAVKWYKNLLTNNA